MNLSETAFVRKCGPNRFKLRWFTPTVEAPPSPNPAWHQQLLRGGCQPHARARVLILCARVAHACMYRITSCHAVSARRVQVDLCGHATLASAHALWDGGFAERGAAIEFEAKIGGAPGRQPRVGTSMPSVCACACASRMQRGTGRAGGGGLTPVLRAQN